MKRVIGLIFILFILGGGAGYYYLTQKVAKAPPVPAYVQTAEQTLAMNGAVFMTHVNVAHAVALEKTFFGGDDPFPLLSQAQEDSKILPALQQNGVDLRQSLHHILGAFFVTPQGTGSVVLLYGQFDAAAVSKAIESAFMVTKRENGILTFTYKDSKTCKISEPKTLQVSDNRIVIASERMMPVIQTRLSEQAAAEIDLTAWNAFRQGRLASFALLMPKETTKALSNGMTRMLVGSAMRKEGQDLESIFAGLAVKTGASAGLNLDTIINTSNAEWPQKTAASIAEAREKFRAESKENMPSLAKLDDYLTVTPGANDLQVSVTLNKKTLQDMQNIVREVIGSMFSGFSSGFGSSNPLEEKTVPAEELPQFLEHYTHAMVKPYNAKDHHFIKADTSVGPFGIMIEKAALIEKDNQKQVELALKVKTGALNNMPVESLHIDGPEGAAATLQLTGIYDDKNQNLFAIEDCGRDRNDEKVALSINTGYQYKDGKNTPYTYLEGKKKVRLLPKVKLRHVKKIDGTITLALPTNIQRKTLNMPLKNQTVETDKVRLFFKGIDKNDLKYEISGQNSHILAVHGLNKDGKVLKSNGGSASGGMLKSAGRSISRTMQGQVAGAEVIYTTNTVEQTYPFSVSSFFQQFETETWGKKIQVVKKDSKKEFAEVSKIYNFSAFCDPNDTAHPITPLQLCLRNIKYYGKHWGMRAQMELAAPASKGLTGNLSGIEIIIGGYKTKDGFIKLLDHQFVNTHLDTYPKDRPPYLKSQNISFRTADPDEVLKDKDVTAVIGKVIVSLPQTMSSKGMFAKRLGSSMTTKSKSLSLIVTEVSYDRITLEAKGDISQLVQIIPMSQDKKPLITKDVQVTSKDDKTFIELKPVGGQPEYLNVIYATKREIMEFPFEIPVPKK